MVNCFNKTKIITQYTCIFTFKKYYYYICVEFVVGQAALRKISRKNPISKKTNTNPKSLMGIYNSCKNSSAEAIVSGKNRNKLYLLIIPGLAPENLSRPDPEKTPSTLHPNSKTNNFALTRSWEILIDTQLSC